MYFFSDIYSYGTKLKSVQRVMWGCIHIRHDDTNTLSVDVRDFSF